MAKRQYAIAFHYIERIREMQIVRRPIDEMYMAIKRASETWSDFLVSLFLIENASVSGDSFLFVFIEGGVF